MPYQESETVELKSVVVDDIKKEIIAFVNTDGGTLYIGVKDDGEVIGVNDPDSAALQVSNMVRDSIKPDVTMFIHYETLDYEGLFDDLLKKYTKEYSLLQVKTANMGTLYELEYRIVLPQETVPRAFLDALRCRNGNLNIVCGRVTEKDAL